MEPIPLLKSIKEVFLQFKNADNLKGFQLGGVMNVIFKWLE